MRTLTTLVGVSLLFYGAVVNAQFVVSAPDVDAAVAALNVETGIEDGMMDATAISDTSQIVSGADTNASQMMSDADQNASRALSDADQNASNAVSDADKNASNAVSDADANATKQINDADKNESELNSSVNRDLSGAPTLVAPASLSTVASIVKYTCPADTAAAFASGGFVASASTYAKCITDYDEADGGEAAAELAFTNAEKSNIAALETTKELAAKRAATATTQFEAATAATAQHAAEADLEDQILATEQEQLRQVNQVKSEDRAKEIAFVATLQAAMTLSQ